MSGFKDHEFCTQYAIRCPDGSLYGSHTVNPAEQMGGWTMMGPMAAWFGGDEEPDEEIIITPPTVWYNRKEVEQALQHLQGQLKNVGIEYWGGQIVERLCSPFTSTDPGQFTDEISKWLREQ